MFVQSCDDLSSPYLFLIPVFQEKIYQKAAFIKRALAPVADNAKADAKANSVDSVKADAKADSVDSMKANSVDNASSDSADSVSADDDVSDDASQVPAARLAYDDIIEAIKELKANVRL